ncbi:tyrosine-type recombinase/integrase [Lysinibacillus xylanilyticus]|uniref:tyrosine-type recombinase/integrase n=1 Tax=Lysinibacillus xylanilyticus TaxID=582475 RepID=UPI003D0671F5
MNEVQPIKNKRDIERMKQSLHGRDLLLFILGINTNLRISDLLRLTREDIVDNAIVLVESKTGKTKRIHLGDNTLEQIKPLLPDTGTLFPSRKGGKPISRQQAWRTLNAAAERAGLTIEFGTHSLRKTFAYHAYKQGVDLALLMRILNHSSQRETLRYIGIETEDITNVYDSVQL